MNIINKGPPQLRHCIDLLGIYITFINLWFLLMFGLSSLYIYIFIGYIPYTRAISLNEIYRNLADFYKSDIALEPGYNL